MLASGIYKGATLIEQMVLMSMLITIDDRKVTVNDIMQLRPRDFFMILDVINNSQ